MRVSTLLWRSLCCACLLAVCGQAQTITTHADLDWTALLRWVHIDNVNPASAHVFETCRHNWLKALHKDGRFLGDGRPLFFCAHGDSAQTYFTLFPFRNWSDMDARAKMARETNSTVGDSAINAYDSGDTTLIPPHGSQIWRRETDSDISWAGVDSLTDITATVGRMERRQVDPYHWDEFNKAWDSVRVVLASQKYPLACRMYTNVYGGVAGDCILLWLAKDATTLSATPSLGDALAQALGKEKAGELISSLNKYFPVKKSYDIESRADLSNLGW